MSDLLELIRESRWLEYLRAIYTAEPIPPCPVCGGKLSVASAGGGQATRWACNAVEPIKTGDWEHYRASQYTQRREGDSKVLVLLDLLESDPELKARAEAALLAWEVSDV